MTLPICLLLVDIMIRPPQIIHPLPITPLPSEDQEVAEHQIAGVTTEAQIAEEDQMEGEEEINQKTIYYATFESKIN